jgi:hypothetical protein
MFWKLDLFTSSDKMMRVLTLLGPSERPNLNHWSSDFT